MPDTGDGAEDGSGDSSGDGSAGAGRTSAVGVLLISGALLAGLVSALAFTVQIPRETSLYGAYAAARPCPTEADAERTAQRDAQRDADCLRTVTFTVDRAEAQGRKGDSYWALVHPGPAAPGSAGEGQGARQRKLSFGDPRPLVETLRPGDQVTGTVWHGAVTTVAKDGVRQDTADAPRESQAMGIATLGTFAGLLAALMAGLGLVRLARPPHHERFGWRGYGRPMLILAAIGSAVPAFLLGWLGLPWQSLPIAATLLCGYTAWEFARYRARTPLDAS
ncbi:hypothetical protein [Streptomyces sp. NPDC090025]|uniref:hypothetical protein n=1 Tax=Streptomyces sp. NPDC090025 TaxID=3365922 RepID=UPI003836592E